MKKLIIVLTSVLGLSLPAFSQDIITTRDGDEIEAKVLEIDSQNVKYRLYSEPDGVMYTVRKADLMMIRYENGRKEVFTNQSSFNRMLSQREPAEGLVPGMKYKELKDIYSPSEYISMPGNPYSPGLSGVLSFLIPGLGQMICDEVGRGFGFLGGSVGLVIVTGVGLGYSYYSIGAAVVATISYIGLLTLDIIAIVDAVKVAKVKNMYVQDMRSAYSFDLNLRPSIDYIPSVSGMQPTVGLTLALNF